MAWSERGRAWGVPWLGLPLSGVLALTGAAHSFWSLEADAAGTPPVASASRLEAESWAGAPVAIARAPDRAAALRPGQTLGAIFADLGLTGEQAQELVRASSPHLDPRQLRQGTPWRAFLDRAGELERFEIELAGRGALAIARDDDAGWRSEWNPFARVTRARAVSGELVGSLEASVVRAGAPPELAYRVADVLQWDLDFTRDLRRGDEFRVLYEELLVAGAAPRPDRVLAVSYGRADGKRLEAFHFGEGPNAGYYDAEGRPLQKMFLRSPLPYSRVTSGFSNRRFHPVLGVFRPHHGVDYGAPTGTPVRVTASGTVVSAAWEGGGGRTVKVRHANGYLTAYLHLSRFASGVRAGSRVRQGDVIGFVGSTGLATAPHLDYRIQAQGRWIDPLSLKAVPAEPISPRERAAFVARRDALLASLEDGRVPAAPDTRLAAAPAAGPRPFQGATAGRKR